jgi:hypothetical protein
VGCNAWNHSSSCNCGWGGVFYGLGDRDASDSRDHWAKSESFTIPNARCPRCAARVFFYRSPFGGSVYFDDLGPPWPKHPCMDVGRVSTAQGRRALNVRPQAPNRTLVESGWRPVPCLGIERHPRCPEVVVLHVVPTVGIAERLYAVVDRLILGVRAPFLAKRLGGGVVEVSTLNVIASVPEEIRFLAYDSATKLPQPFADQTRLPPVLAVTRPTVQAPKTSHRLNFDRPKRRRTVKVTYARSKKAPQTPSDRASARPQKPTGGDSPREVSAIEAVFREAMQRSAGSSRLGDAKKKRR